MNKPNKCSIPKNLAQECGSWGRGIEKITNACAEYGCPAPIFEATPTGVQVTLLPKFKMSPQVAQQANPQVGTKSEPSSGTNCSTPYLAGLVEMTVPEKPTSRLQKYRLTNDALSIIQPPTTD
jgi:ATP-dependent DNA helicase RecG